MNHLPQSVRFAHGGPIWVFLLLAWIASMADAATVSWDKSAGTLNWGDANNWNPNGLPSATSDVSFADVGLADNDVISLGGVTRSIASISFNTSTSPLNYTLSNGTLNLVGGTAPLELQNLQNSTVTIERALTRQIWKSP